MTLTGEASAPVLDGAAWIDVVRNSEQGEEIPAPAGLHSFIRGQATVIGAPTKVGKTILGLQSFRYVVDSGYRAAYCTLEMSPSLLFQRFWPMFGSEEACSSWVEQNDPYVSHSYLDVHEVEQILRLGFDFVVIDHLQELPREGHEEFSRKISRIASLAPETNTAILLLSQMKQPDGFYHGPPRMYDFSGTKSIPEVAAVIQAIWRPDEDSPDVELVTMGHRFQEPNYPVKLRMDRQTITFERVL